jgi:GDSL-like Lipase/Acylhydrolase family
MERHGKLRLAAHRRFGPVAILASLLLGLVLLGCGGGAATASVEVSMGDSYSSGEGGGHYDRGTRVFFGNGCHRSARAWPRLLGVSEGSHLACSGATTEDFFEPQKSGPLAGADGTSQLSRLRSLDRAQPVTRVYVTIGGNDLGFARIIRNCVFLSCLLHMDETELPRLRDEVAAKVTRTLRAVRRVVGDDEVVLVGYPDLIPPLGKELVHCGWLSAVERVRILRLEAELNSTLAAVATDAGVEFVPVRAALRGHELCTADPWVNPIARFESLFAFQEQGHPTPAGQRAIAAAVVRSQ